MLHICAGENRILSDALVRSVGDALAAGDNPLYIVVPRQLTLLTERLLLDALKLPGSFRLRVLSPARLCALIFDEAGAPEGVRVDERGRVLLMRRAIRACADLTIYKNADRRRGFAERCARQLELFIQGGVSPDDLRACAAEARGAARMKMLDLAAILQQYQELIRGRFQDGDTELIEAGRRVSEAAFLREGRFWFFGFDITPPTLTRLIARIAMLCPEAAIYLPLPNDPGARDYDCYLPLERAMLRLFAACREEGAEFAREALDAEPDEGCLAALRRELFAYPPEPFAGEIEGLGLACARDVREECMLAAARARTLAMRGVRYGEMQLLCGDLESYRQPLSEAFAAYGVPLFQEGSRPVSRLATAECLLTALKLIDKNFRAEDAFTLMRCGYMNLSDDEAGRLANYAVRCGLEGARWLRPLNRGAAVEIAELEPIRKRLMEPVRKLRDELKAAEDLKGQLTALFGFLTEIDAHGRSLELQRRLIEGGMREAAGALTQSWNRIIGALDQMAGLMGEEKLSLRELDQALTESLEAAVVKPLPQSGDAVYAQSLGRMLMQPAKALFVIGLGDAGGASDDGLLTPGQRRAVEERTKAYLGPDEADSARLRRFYLKAALGMAAESVWFSCALSGADGSAQRPGLTMQLLRELFPELRALSEAEKSRLLACAPRAALGRSARALSARRAGEAPDPGDLAALSALRTASAQLPAAGDRLRCMERLLEGREGREAVDPASARALYGALQAQSVTRLERFARCPFSYFAAYGLRPERVEPFEFDYRDEGVFLHDAMSAFLRAHRAELNELAPEAAEAAMDRIARELLSAKLPGSPMEDSAGVRAQSRALLATARRCARVLVEHMKGSAFRAEELERSFGREDEARQLRAGDTVLEGRIDRMDYWREGDSLRIIDYKRGGKALSLAGTWHGLELQLPLYLGAAMKRRGARSAGVYYFALDEGVVDTQATDPSEVERERARRFRMAGLLPADAELIRAQTPTPESVFSARMKANGELFAGEPRASDGDYERLVRCALRRAQEHIARIRAGEAAVRPASFENRDACKFCDYRAACLFDPKLDASKARKLKKMKWDEALERMALEEDEGRAPARQREGESKAALPARQQKGESKEPQVPWQRFLRDRVP